MPHLEREFTELISQPNEVDEICRAALENWRAFFRQHIFVENLRKYRALQEVAPQTSSDQQELQTIYRYFKEIRKAAQYLRTTYLLFDVSHEEPESFHTFVWQLGQLKDTFDHPQQALPHVAILEELLSRPVTWGELPIQPDTIERILVAARQPLDRVRTLVEFDNLPARDFHHLRKKLRMFTNIYTLAVKYGRTGKIKEMKDLLVQINDELGDINDEMVARSVRGEAHYDHNIVDLPPALKLQIRQLLIGQNQE